MTPPIAAVKAGFRQYLRFSGRATRPEFWWWMLFIAVASIILGIIDGIISAAAGSGFVDFEPLSTLFGLATLLPTLAITSRRLHDIGKSGWWQLLWYAAMGLAWAVAAVLLFIALAGIFAALGWSAISGGLAEALLTGALYAALPALLAFIAALAITPGVIIWAIIWLVRPGEPAANRYGPDPRAARDDEPPAYPGQNDWYTEPPR